MAKRKGGQTMIQRSRAIPPSDKAGFAMEGRVKREFFGLTEADEEAIVQRIEAGLDEALKE